jgi:hypothetical protein
MKITYLMFLLLSLTTLACNSDLSVMSGVPLQKQTGATKIFALSRLQAKAGDLVEVSGVNLSPGLFVQIGGKNVPLTLSSTSSAFFIMPESEDNLGVGATFVTNQKETLGTLALVNQSSDVQIPVMDADPGVVCSDTTYQDSSGHLKVGSRNCSASYPICVSGGAKDCVASETFPTVNRETLATQANKIRVGTSIASVNGTLADCSADGATDCIATANFPALNRSLLTAGVLKSGTIIAGVTGAYPSVSYPLAGQTLTADLDSATFNAKIKSSIPFEWFDSSGNHYLGAGDADITSANLASGIDVFSSTGTFAPPCVTDGQTGCLASGALKAVDTSALSTWDIRQGRSAGGIAGSLKFHKNLADLTQYNRNTGSFSNASGSVADFYDTINDNGSSGVVAATAPTGFPNAPGASWLRDPNSDNGAGGGIAGNSICDGTEDCVYLDRIPQVYWAKDDGLGQVNWDTAIANCENRTYGGYTDWRLPTQKEFYQAMIDGIISVKNPLSLQGNFYWSATTDGGTPSDAWSVWLYFGQWGGSHKVNSSNNVFCVRSN